MSTTRRKFLSISASSFAAATIGPHVEQAGFAAQTSAVSAFEQTLLRARPVPLSKVRLLGGPLKLAQEADAKYLLELEPDRMMAFYRLRAGLTQKAQPYGGWDA